MRPGHSVCGNVLCGWLCADCRVHVALAPRCSGFGLQQWRGEEGAAWWERTHSQSTLHPAVPGCSCIPAFPAAPPPALQKKPSLPVLQLTADWKIQFPCELLGTRGLVTSSEARGHLSQECGRCCRAAVLRADDARLCLPPEPGETLPAP